MEGTIIEITDMEMMLDDVFVEDQVSFNLWFTETTKETIYSRSEAELFCGSEIGVI